MDPVFLAELAINGALTGLLYSLFAIGLVLIYKASSVPNLAQGGLTMVGAYVVLALARDVGMPLWLAIPLAIAIMFGLGFGIERVALRRLAGRPVVMILMLTLGLDIFLRGTTLAVWGGTSRSMELGISYEPLFLGDILISRIHLVGSVVANCTSPINATCSVLVAISAVAMLLWARAVAQLEPHHHEAAEPALEEAAQLGLHGLSPLRGLHTGGARQQHGRGAFERTTLTA